MYYSKKSYCGGLFCNKKDRKIKCVSCGVYVCGVCSVKNKCIDCFVMNNVKELFDYFDTDKKKDKKIIDNEDNYITHEDMILEVKNEKA